MKLPSWFRLSNLFNKKLPAEFEKEEPILRTIYHPFNFKKDNVTIRQNLYQPPPNSEEVSVNRLKYTTEHFCKKLGKHYANGTNRNFYGFSYLKAHIIQEQDFSLVYSPILKKKRNDDLLNKFHSDILIGHTVIPNEEIPAEIRYKIKLLTEQSTIYKDSNPDSDYWCDEEIS